MDAFVERARTLWQRATPQNGTKLELYLKRTERIRSARERIHRVLDAGVAVRTIKPRRREAGFAAAAGQSDAAVRWAVDRSLREDYTVSATTPDGVPEIRWDIDPPSPLPTEDRLRRWHHGHPGIDWIEAGTTDEILVGPTGWVAVRRRHRVWGLVGRDVPVLMARRGIPDLDEVFAAPMPAPRGRLAATTGGGVAFLPTAAAPLVAALVRRFHMSADAAARAGGPGWSVIDDPTTQIGLVGGDFDDVGHSTRPIELSVGGRIIGCLDSAGCFYRKSYRMPPTTHASNLLIAPVDASLDDDVDVVSRCRVIPLSADEWVLEMERDRGGHYARVAPESLLRGCISGIGPVQVTADGPIIPSLIFDGEQFP